MQSLATAVFHCTWAFLPHCLLYALQVLEVSSHHLGIFLKAVVWEGGIQSLINFLALS